MGHGSYEQKDGPVPTLRLSQGQSCNFLSWKAGALTPNRGLTPPNIRGPAASVLGSLTTRAAAVKVPASFEDLSASSLLLLIGIKQRGHFENHSKNCRKKNTENHYFLIFPR